MAGLGPIRLPRQKYECTRLILTPMSLSRMRRGLRLYTSWFNDYVEGRKHLPVVELRRAA